MIVAAVVGLLATLCAPLAPLFDPDEGYYPATAAETLRSGAFWDLRFNGAPRWDKPIFSYALIEGTFWLLGESVAAARLPSALEGAGLVAITGWLVAQLAGERAGMLGALVLGTTLGVGVFSKAAHPEIGLVTSTMTTQLLGCFWWSTVDKRRQRSFAVGAGVAVAFGVLTKGPVAATLPVLAMLGLVAYIRPARAQFRRFAVHATLSFALAIALAAPWYVVMAARYGWAFLYEAVWAQNVGRYTTTAYGHSTSAATVWLAALVGLFPWVTLLPQALWRLRMRPTGSRELLRAAMCIGALSALSFYSLSTSKLASYAFAAVPCLAVVVGLWLDERLDDARQLRRAWMLSGALFACLGTLFLTAHLWVGRIVQPHQLFGGNRPPGADSGALLAPVTVSIGSLLLVSGLLLLVTRRPRPGTAIVALVGAMVPVAALVVSAPLVREMYPWESLSRLIRSQEEPVWLLGRRAPSLTFYTPAPVHVAPDVLTLERGVGREPRCSVIVTGDEWAQLSARMAVRATIVGRRGRMVLVHLASDR